MNSTVQEIRKQYDALVEQLESEGFCVSRECMCDMAAPVVKLGAAIAELERNGIGLPKGIQEALNSGDGTYRP